MGKQFLVATGGAASVVSFFFEREAVGCAWGRAPWRHFLQSPFLSPFLFPLFVAVREEEEGEETFVVAKLVVQCTRREGLRAFQSGRGKLTVTRRISVKQVGSWGSVVFSF